MSGLRIAGYAALFGVADAGRDTILPGAFRETLRARRTPFPLYWQHHPEQRIGWVETVGEDGRGLRVIATIDNPMGRAGRMLRAHKVSGLSFGYRRALHESITISNKTPKLCFLLFKLSSKQPILLFEGRLKITQFLVLRGNSKTKRRNS